jgi:PKD repeat protein
MKKLIVILLLACGGAIYFLASSCDELLGESVGPSEEGCTLLSLPEVDFTADKKDNVVGETVTFRYTGTLGGDEEMNVSWYWEFPGTDVGFVRGKNKNPTVQYIKAGVYEVVLTVVNRCWLDKERKAGFIIINPGK